MQFNIDDEVICVESGVFGKIIGMYKPTLSEEQIMIRTFDSLDFLDISVL